MTSWSITLYQIGGIPILLILGLLAVIVWLLREVKGMLSSYSKQLMEKQAEIDVRLANIDRLVSEQERLTRTVETVEFGHEFWLTLATNFGPPQ
jgi:hypothetical protein